MVSLSRLSHWDRQHALQSIVLNSDYPEIVIAEEQSQVKEIDSEELKISFSTKYMTDALKAIDGRMLKSYSQGR